MAQKYLFIAILCVKMSHVNNSPNFNIKIFFTFQLLFDKEFESNPIEKIKVISSTYMAACGLLPGRNSSLETPASAFNEPFTRFDQGIDPTEPFFAIKLGYFIVSSTFFMGYKLSSLTSRKQSQVGLTPGLNFINVLRTAFSHICPECAKKDSQVSSVIWHFWDLRA